MSSTRLQTKSEIAKLLQGFRMYRLKEKGVTDFTDVDRVIRAIHSCVKNSYVRESYLQLVSDNYPDVQAYKYILKYVTFSDIMKSDVTCITPSESLFIKLSNEDG